MTETGEPVDISGRLVWVRRRVFGERGRATLSRAIGVSPSTYNYYEKGRQMPADLLAKVAQVTGADLRWLLTGDGSPFPTPPSTAADIGLSQGAQDIVARFLAGAEESDAASGARAALRAILAKMDQAFPAPDWRPSETPVAAEAIPVVGRTAAGLPTAWERFFVGKEDPQVLDQLIQRTEAGTARERTAELKVADPAAEPDRPRDSAAMLIQLSEPTADGVVEYLQLPGLPSPAPGTFALRVDGDSMSPRILDGDIVVCRRGVEPEAGQTAVVRIRDHIGLTVKLWRPEGDQVHLIPINEIHPQRAFRRSDIVWACRVLWVVRL